VVLRRERKISERFSVPRVVSCISGDETLIHNHAKIAGYLRREPSHLRKFLLKRLATGGSVKGGVLVLRGKHSGEILQRKLEEYVDEFVRCQHPECRCPDTELVRKDGSNYVQCQAVLEHLCRVEDL